MAITPTSGTASGGSMIVTVSGSAKASSVTSVGDAVYMVELYEGTTQLAYQYFDVTYNNKDMPYNTARTISMQAGLGVGSHSLRVRASMINGSESYTGYYTVNVASAELVNNAGYVTHSAPSEVVAGQAFSVSVTMSNSGTKPWGSTGAQLHRLGSQYPENNEIWGVNRIPLPSSTISPGASATFNFTRTAPATLGTQYLQFKMVQEGVEWFGPYVTIPVNVVAGNPTGSFSSPANNATFTASSSGGTATVTFSGSASPGAGASMSSLSLLENGVSFGSNASTSISASKALSVGQHTIELRATNSAGKTASYYRTVTVVNPAPAPTLTVDPTSFALKVGQSSTVTWSSTNATSVSRVCTASGTGYSGTVSLATSDSRSETGNSAWVGYPSTCTWTATGAGGSRSVTQTMTTTVGPTISVSPNPLTLQVGQQQTITYTTTNATTLTRVCTASGTGYAGTMNMALGSTTRVETGQASWVGYPSTCTWTASGSSGSSSVTQIMTTTSPGTVTISNPVNYSTLVAKDATLPILVQGTATPSTGATITKIEAIESDTVLHTATGSSGIYSQSLAFAPGVYWLRLRATDSKGLQATSPSASFVVVAATEGNGAEMVSQDVPTSMRAGQPYTVTVRMRNTGKTTWTDAADYKLGSQNPQDNRTFGGRAFLSSNVATGETGVFTFQVTAPSTPGTYNFQWQMVQEWVGWFGNMTQNVPITVTTGAGPAASLSASPTNVRVSGTQTQLVTFTGNGSNTSGTVTKLELFRDSGRGYGLTPIHTVTGSSASLNYSNSLSLAAGAYAFKLRATNSAGVQTDSAQVRINITNSALLGAVSGVRSNAAGNAELYGWVCQPGNAAGLSYQVLLDAPTPDAGGVSIATGVANVATESDNAAVQSQCGTPGAAHHFKVDLSSHVAAYAGRSVYVMAATANQAQTVTLPCADNNCTMPGTLRVVMSTPQNGDQVSSSNPAFLRMQLTNYTGTYDEAGFFVDGAWVAAVADSVPGAYTASKSGLVARAAPYTVYAKIRKGNTTLYSMPVEFTVTAAATAQLTVTSPSSGATLTQGSAQQLSATVTGTVQSVKFYANGSLIGNATNAGSAWQMSWTPNTAGSTAITARAFDGNGAQVGISAAVNVTVSAGSSSGATPTPINVAIPQLTNADGGSLTGKLVATNNGTASYAIPLMLPPGTAGMAPSLSLAYDSSSPSGTAGQGWSLGGISSIERCGRTHANDWGVSGVRFSANIGGMLDEPVDRLCIDGQRLILVNGGNSNADYWKADAEYRTEVETFTRVRTVINARGERTFVVETRDGRTAYFGDTTDSYIQAIGRADGQAYRWRVSRVVDRSSNYMSYFYDEDGTTGENRPVEIRWGGNTAANTPHYAAVRLAYEARSDKRKAYIGGAPSFQNTRLKEVTSYVGIAASGSGGAVAQRYTLEYETSAVSSRSLLKSVRACDSTACLPATTFDYGTRSSATPGFVSLGGPRVGPNLYALGNNGAGSGYAAQPLDEIIVGDFNGDGKADILERYSPGGGRSQQMYESNPDGMGWTAKPAFTFPININDLPLAVMETGDFDGDGRADLLIAKWSEGSPATNWRICWGRDFGSNGFVCNGSFTPPARAWSQLVPPQLTRIVRDLNGDGMDDILFRGGSDPETDPFRFFQCDATGSGFVCTEITNSAMAYAFGNPEDLRPSAGTSQDDMDGDGIPDKVDLGRCYQSLRNEDGSGGQDWVCNTGYAGGDEPYIQVGNISVPGVAGLYGEWDRAGNKQTSFLPPAPSGSLTGDFNGDGYSDVVFGTFSRGASPPSPRRRICLSKGNGESDCGDLPASTTPDRDHLVVTVADFDGDGMPEVLRPTNDTFSNDNINGYQLCKIGASGGTHSCEPWAGPVFYGLSADRVLGSYRGLAFSDRDYVRPRSAFLGDFDGDGKPDIATYTGGQGSTWEIYGSADLAKSGEALDKLVRVTNGAGLVEEAVYAKANAADVYSPTVTAYTGTFAPKGKRTQPGQLVRTIRSANGQGGWLSTEYTYRGNAYDPKRRAALGFAQVVIRDVQNAVTTTNWFYQSFPYTGMLQYSRTVGRSGQTLATSEAVVATRAIPQVGQSYTIPFPYVATAQARRFDLEGSFVERTLVNSAYDDWGNATQTRRDSYASDAGSAQVVGTVTVDRTYDNDRTSWRIGELRTNVETRTMAGDTISRKSAYTYNGAGLLATETMEPDNSALRVEKTYGRRSENLFGLVNTTTLEWLDPQSGSTRTRIVSDVDYTTDGRFVATRKNALNHLESLQFDSRNGAMTQLTDINGLVSSAAYDGFGRQLRATAADGTETWTYYKGCNANCPSHAKSVQIVDTRRGAQQVDVPKLVFSDAAGKPVRTLTSGFDGKKVIADTEYDALGRVWRTWQPLKLNSDADALVGTVPSSAVPASEFAYDDLGRVTSVKSRDEQGGVLTSTNRYNGLVVTATNAKSQTKVESKDVWGRLVEVLDAASNKTVYTYDAFSNLKTTTDPANNVITITYDKLGRKTVLKDPDLGTITYEVDPLGQVWRQRSPNQAALGAPIDVNSTRMGYDELGRMTSRVSKDHSAGWTYDKLASQTDCRSNRSCGKLVESFTLAGTSKDFRQEQRYDSLGRPDLVTVYQADATYTSRTEYDTWGRVVGERHQRGSGAEKAFDRRYNAYGYLQRIERGSMVLWQATDADAQARITAATLGNGLNVARSYNPYTGRLSSGLVSKQGATMLQEGYSYDSLGNVMSRNQSWGTNAFIEGFTYDSLNRLKTSLITGQAEQVFDYNAIGNLLQKTGVGNYAYPASGANSVRPHAVSSIPAGSFTYDDNGNMLTAPGRGTTWTWTSFDMPKRATKGSAYSDFTYGADYQRLRQDRSDGTAIYYAGAMETEVQGAASKVKTYWPMGLGVEIESNGATVLRWTHADRLGSVVAISNETGAVEEKLAYDVWGKRRQLETTATPDSIDGVVDNKGYTGHEMLDQIDLVHMNGRVYDPLVGRFVSADPLIQEPSHGQSFNRYSYVWNNPTNLTDPTGFQTIDNAQPATQTGCGASLSCHMAALLERSTNACASLGSCTVRGYRPADEELEKVVESANNGGVIMPFLKDADEKFAKWHGGALPLISPEKAEAAAASWGQKADETGNWLYRIPEKMAAFFADHPDEVLMILSVGKASPKSGVPGKNFVAADNVVGPYIRPKGAGPTAEQRASVQGKPCVDCGALSKNQVADHIEPLVVQHYRTGSVNVQQQRSVNAVQPHCPQCSAIQGGQLSTFSRLMKNFFGF